MNKYTLLIEKSLDGKLWGRIDVPDDDYLPITVGNTLDEVKESLITLIEDHISSDDEVKFFKNFNKNSVVFEIKYEKQTNQKLHLLFLIVGLLLVIIGGFDVFNFIDQKIEILFFMIGGLLFGNQLSGLINLNKKVKV